MLPTIPPFASGEAAFEALADYFVVAIIAARGDEALLRKAVTTSIRRFYDANEVAGKPRSGADTFYLVEGTKNGVPIQLLRKQLGTEVPDRIEALWPEVQ